MQAIEATHNTRCEACELAINEGEQIVKVDDEWVHVDCAEELGEDVER